MKIFIALILGSILGGITPVHGNCRKSISRTSAQKRTTSPQERKAALRAQYIEAGETIERIYRPVRIGRTTDPREIEALERTSAALLRQRARIEKKLQELDPSPSRSRRKN
jgi:hypothetical protein